jgi:hypothetical protein
MQRPPEHLPLTREPGTVHAIEPAFIVPQSPLLQTPTMHPSSEVRSLQCELVVHSTQSLFTHISEPQVFGH